MSDLMWGHSQACLCKRWFALLPSGSSELSNKDRKELEGQLKAREDLLLPMYHQVAVHFADLHDKPGRMLEKGAICVRACHHGVSVNGPSCSQHTQDIWAQAFGMCLMPHVRVTWGALKTS